MIPINYNVRSLLVRKTTTLATALGIALVVFVFAVGADARRAASSKTLAQLGPRATSRIVLRKGSDAELSSTHREQQRRACVLGGAGREARPNGRAARRGRGRAS